MKVRLFVSRLLAICLLFSLAVSPVSSATQAAPDSPEAVAALGEPIVVFEGINRIFGTNAGDLDVNPPVAPPSHLNDANIIGKVPDVAGAAGRVFYLQAVNKVVALFQKGTMDIVLYPGVPYYWPNPVEAVSFDQLWANVAGNPAYATGTDCDGPNHHGQPNVVYDHKAGVWVLLDVAYQQANINTGPYYICVAISTNRMEVSPPPYFVNTYPTAINWYFYAIPVTIGGTFAYPDSIKLGAWSDGYYLAADMINIENNGIQRLPMGAKAWVMNRSDMLGGVPQSNLRVLSQELPIYMFEGQYEHLVPSNWMGGPDPDIPNYFAAIRPGRFFLWKATVNWPSLSFMLGNALAPSFTLSTDTSTIWAGGAIVPQPGTQERVDALGYRLTNPLQYRRLGDYSSLWASHSVVWNNATAIRWYELQGMEVDNPFFYQIGTYGGPSGFPSAYRWVPSMATDKAGNMAMGYSLSRVASPSIYPSIYYTGRLVNDPPGTISQDEFLLNVTGMPNPYTASQFDIDTFPDGPWGRQSQMTVDPVDECVFWFTNMYYTYETYDAFGNPIGDGTTWHTRIGAFTLPECRSGGLKRVSLHTNGTEGNAASGRDIQMYSTAISASGRYVVFTSLASNLVDLATNGYNDTNGKWDVFVRDRDYDNDGIFDEPGAVRTERLPLSIQPNGDSNEVSISADGRYVVFASYASNLVPNDIAGFQDIFLVDRDADADGVFDEPAASTIRRVSVINGTLNGEANGNSQHPFISGNGRYVVFSSIASNLVTGANNAFYDVFVHDRDTDNDGIFDEAGAVSTELISVGFPAGTPADGHSDQPTVSSDGRFIAFRSAATNLQELQGATLVDGNGFTDIYVRDTLYDDTILVSVQDITLAPSNNHSFTPYISGNGSVIVFASLANNLLDPALLIQDLNVFTDIYWANNPLYGYIPTVVPPQLPGHRLISVNLLGQLGNDDSYTPSTNDDGSVVVFASDATNLDVFFPDTNGVRDIFLNNLLVTYGGAAGTGATQRISINNALGESNDRSFAPVIASGNPTQVSFVSAATNLVRNDHNYVFDVFAYDGEAGTPVFLKVLGNTTPVLPGQNVSVQVRFYDNGYGIDAVTYSIDFDQSCLAYINTSFPVIPGFTFDPPLYDPLDTDGELDYALYSFTHNVLPNDSLIATISFQVTGQCTGLPGTPEIGRVGFSRNPEAYFTGFGQDVYGITIDGFVRIGGGNRGDCNKDGRVTAADLSWLIYEIFDGDGNLPADVVNPPYVSDPVGCNPNLDGVVDAGDLPCTVKVLFNGPLASCSAPLSASGFSGEELQPYAVDAPAQISVPLKSIVAAGGKVYLPVTLAKQGNAVSSLAFSINYDQTWLSFDNADRNGDGMPDSIIWFVPSGYAKSVFFNPADSGGELDFSVYNTSTTAQPLPDGTFVIVILNAGSPPGQFVANIVGSNEPAASFGSVYGHSVTGSFQGGTVWIGLVKQIFMPLIRR